MPGIEYSQPWSDHRCVRVLGTGAALPGVPVTTDEILDRLYANFGVDVRRRGRCLAGRLGINSRYFSRDLATRHENPRTGDSNAELAARALRSALDEAAIEPRELSYLVGHTATPGTLMPPNVARVADLLDYKGPFIELRQACTGFANALVFALGLLSSPACGPVAIVGSETGSIYFDPLRAGEDSGQLVNALQMGDGAGACVLGPHEGIGTPQIKSVFFGYAGANLEPGFSLRAGSDSPPGTGKALEFEHDYGAIHDRGRELFAVALSGARSAGIDPREIDHFVPHQANGHLAQHLSTSLGLDAARIFVNADRLGNTGSAAVWLALHELRARLSHRERVCVLGAEATKYLFGGFLYTHA